jgi:hypothetical protein
MSVVSQRCWNALLVENQRESTIHHGHWWSRASENSDWIHNGECQWGLEFCYPWVCPCRWIHLMDAKRLMESYTTDGCIWMGYNTWSEWEREKFVGSQLGKLMEFASACPKIFCSHRSDSFHTQCEHCEKALDIGCFYMVLYSITTILNDKAWNKSFKYQFLELLFLIFCNTASTTPPLASLGTASTWSAQFLSTLRRI